MLATSSIVEDQYFANYPLLLPTILHLPPIGICIPFTIRLQSTWEAAYDLFAKTITESHNQIRKGEEYIQLKANQGVRTIHRTGMGPTVYSNSAPGIPLYTLIT